MTSAAARPESVVIMGLTFTVRDVPRDHLPGDGSMAAANFARQELLIAAEQHPEQARDSLFHEVLHMLLRGLDVEGRKVDERAVNVIATGLLDTLRRNPPLVAYLFGPDPA